MGEGTAVLHRSLQQPGEAMTSEQIVGHVSQLVEAWCDRRALRALRHVLPAWPLSSGLTDDWGQLLQALHDVQAFAKDDLTPEELQNASRLIAEVQHLIERR